ncbi:MAG: OsmC family protein [Acidobacteria bacterium]|nr:OsmC family protein [Acidobacteriota bacterium]
MASDKPAPPNLAGEGQPGKKSEGHQFTIGMDLVQDYRFMVRFDKDHYPGLLMDEPPPLGGDTAPNASRILAAAVGNCLSASLLFCVRKARINVEQVHADVTVRFARNERGRLRIANIDVRIEPSLAAADRDKAQRCLELFEDYCVVTQSVRNGIDVSVHVSDPA